LENGLAPYSCSEVGTSSAWCLEGGAPSRAQVFVVVLVWDFVVVVAVVLL